MLKARHKKCRTQQLFFVFHLSNLLFTLTLQQLHVIHSVNAKNRTNIYRLLKAEKVLSPSTNPSVHKISQRVYQASRPTQKQP